MSQPTRALMPDYLRLVALFGIVAVNVQFMAFPTTASFSDPPPLPPGEAVAHWLVQGLALLKSYGLFSFMFGVGLGFLMQSAARRGLDFGAVYRNRMLGLAGLGLLHGCLFFPGDILVIYAITGSLLYRWRDWAVARLVRVGGLLIAGQLLISVPALLFLPDAPPDLEVMEREVMTQGGLIDTVLFRAVTFAVTLPSFLILQGISALGWFCLGLAAVKSGLIDASDHPLWARARRVCLIPGVAVSLIGAAVWEWGSGPVGIVITLVAAPVATLGYLGLIAAIARPPGPLMARLLTAGGSSLSIYLGQSIVLSTLFASYGLGLWGAVTRGEAVTLAVAVTLALIGGLALWRRRFALGPFEWLLRRFTYRGAG